MEQVTIIGTGCAGLTAALYTARANLSPLVLTGHLPGGLLTTTSIVENYPGFPEGIDGYELMSRMQKQAEKFGAKVKFGTLEKVDLKQGPFKLTVDGEVIETRTVIIATGSSHKHLGLENESLLEKKGVTFCATCDGALPMFKHQPLVVVGGGDSALEEATFLTRYGSVVYLVHRREEFRGSKIMVERALKNDKVKPILNSEVVDILDIKQGKVTGVKLKDVKTGKISEVACAGVFVAIGHLPNTEVFKGQVETTPAGYVKLRGAAGTNIEGVFVAGDVADSIYRQAVTAAGTGCAAAIEAERYLSGLEKK